MTVRAYGGTDLEVAVAECIELNKKTGVHININFNGIDLMIDDSRSVDDVVSEWEDRSKMQNWGGQDGS